MINMESITNSSKIIKNKLGENVALDIEKGLIHIDYYSAVRVGFGTPHTDEVIEMLNNL